MTVQSIPPEVVALHHDVSHALSDDSLTLSLRQQEGDPGTEPMVVFRIGDDDVFTFRRDELIEGLYSLGVDVLTDLQRRGEPLTANGDRGSKS